MMNDHALTPHRRGRPLPSARLLMATQIAGALALVTLISCAPSSAFAQALPDTSPAAKWRALSRFGYGPTPQSAAQISSARAWALSQLDAAKIASGKAVVIPTEYAHINASANDITREYGEVLQARQAQNRAPAQAATPAAATNAMPTSATMAGNAATTPPTMSPTMPAISANVQAREEFFRDKVQHTGLWRLMSCSDPNIEQPMLSRMSEFWFNHFNVQMAKGPVRVYTGSYMLSAIRPHALGRFEDLLLATAQHPAMMHYLDQQQSNARGLNENYARELMELHTLGVNGGYTQNDVRELARILTGWSSAPGQGQAFFFRAGAHDDGDKLLLGQTIRGRKGSEGLQEGQEAIRMLARHPATAQRIATRLASFFVMDKPSPALVKRLADSFTRSEGDIMTVMRTLVESPELWEANNTLFKTPLDFICSSAAATGGFKHEREALQARGFLDSSGQPLLNWLTPDGYKTDRATWLAPEALTRRADYAISIGNRVEEPLHLQAFMSATSRERIARESSPQLRAGLMLASPDFMQK
jgi:uncharacterized protein (DUF1800 family)